MAEPDRKRPKITPRNSENQDENVPPEVTPYEDLHKLAGLIQKPSTPGRRISSSGISSRPASASRILVHTPGTASRTPRPNTIARFPNTRRVQPTTPHALRALQQRKNAATPARNRRRSGRQQRETPRDALRELSKVLARNTQPIAPSPQVTVPTPRKSKALDDFDVGPEVLPPRLSLPLGALEDDDSFHAAPPRLSEVDLEDKENYTTHSVEAGRDRGLLHRDSFGSVRASELFSEKLGDLSQLGNDGDDSGDHGHYESEEEDLEDVEDGISGLIDEVTRRTLADGENTQEFRALIDASRRQSRPSDLGIASSPGMVEEETFQFRFQDKPRNSLAPTIFVDDEPEEAQAQSDEGEDDNVPFAFDEGHSDGVDDAEVDGMIDEATAYLETAPTPRPLREDSLAHELLPPPLAEPSKLKQRQRRELKVSKHGIQYPSLPLPVIKKLATTFARTNGACGAKSGLSKDTLLEIEKATDWFFEQLGEDLGAYAQHAGRKQIQETDVVAVMKRQRVLNAGATTFSLAQKYLGRELCQEIRMPAVKKGRKRKALDTIREEDE
ncbi:hypothetical protein NA57DRAFT_50812 [Rhizodiscina lignyota]|uniref:CENP-T/Histone H4 histone fold domain-containing protein n=1 Tax=Rhizodiscina lignyota TaxID=1504668 RepID=A0A9P4IQ15_9PEZI|nr:hypothetical protein NA57DRAFT_50812 [Rhizodiscina lignyota]